MRWSDRVKTLNGLLMSNAFHLTEEDTEVNGKKTRRNGFN